MHLQKADPHEESATKCLSGLMRIATTHRKMPDPFGHPGWNVTCRRRGRHWSGLSCRFTSNTIRCGKGKAIFTLTGLTGIRFALHPSASFRTVGGFIELTAR